MRMFTVRDFLLSFRLQRRLSISFRRASANTTSRFIAACSDIRRMSSGRSRPPASFDVLVDDPHCFRSLVAPDDGFIPNDGFIPDDGFAPDDGFIPNNGFIPDNRFVPDNGFVPHDGLRPNWAVVEDRVCSVLFCSPVDPLSPNHGRSADDLD